MNAKEAIDKACDDVGFLLEDLQAINSYSLGDPALGILALQLIDSAVKIQNIVKQLR